MSVLRDSERNCGSARAERDADRARIAPCATFAALRVFFAASLAAFLALAGCTSTLDADDLARSEHGLAALGAEAAMLVEQFAHGDVTQTYAGVHCEKLLERQRELAGNLDTPSPSVLDTRSDAARDAADRLGRVLRHLGDALARGAPVTMLADEIRAVRRALPPGAKTT